MAWYSYPYGAAVSPGLLAPGGTARDVLNALAESPHYVAAASRNGTLLTLLRQLVDCAPPGIALFLLDEQAVLQGDAITGQLARIEGLLADLQRDPGIALQATRQAHSPGGTLQAEGFEPLAYQTVYGPDCRIEDGWVYFYTAEQVLAQLASASVGPDPKPAHDDDGESLEYVFGFLKSQAALLRRAAADGLCIVYAEMNPPG